MTTPDWDRMAALLAVAKAAHAAGQFDYRTYFTTNGHDRPPAFNEGEADWCGSTACFAGHALILWENPLWIRDKKGRCAGIHRKSSLFYTHTAGDLLGLNELQAHDLFLAIPVGELAASHLPDGAARAYYEAVARWRVLHPEPDYPKVQAMLGLAYLEMLVASKTFIPIHLAVPEIVRKTSEERHT